jgi:hypothetical protein
MQPSELIQELQHHEPDWLAEATVDRDQALIRNVALLGAASRNGYRYTAEAMQAAAPLYDGRPVFVDHGAASQGLEDSSLGLRRSIRDYAGQVLSPRYEQGRVRGDLRLAGPNTAWLLDLIAAQPSDIGMSHVVLARRKLGGDEVDHIERVVSVDIVAFPATTRSFLEATLSGGRQPPESGARPVSGDLRPPLSPERLLALLEALLRGQPVDVPTSLERGARGADAAPLAKKALITAIRGN